MAMPLTRLELSATGRSSHGCDAALPKNRNWILAATPRETRLKRSVRSKVDLAASANSIHLFIARSAHSLQFERMHGVALYQLKLVPAQSCAVSRFGLCVVQHVMHDMSCSTTQLTRSKHIHRSIRHETPSMTHSRMCDLWLASVSYILEQQL